MSVSSEDMYQITLLMFSLLYLVQQIRTTETLERVSPGKPMRTFAQAHTMPTGGWTIFYPGGHS